MLRLSFRIGTLLMIVGGLTFGFQQGKDTPSTPPFDFERCPCKAKVGEMATVDLPKGTVFVDKANVAKFLEYNHNIPDGDEQGAVISIEDNWFIIYSFQDVGYVKDDEKANLDADALLKSIREGTEAANEERRRRGWGTMAVTGWHEKPHYDEISHNLEWSIVGQNEKGSRSVNHNSRFLGRRGVMSANLVTSPESVTENLASFSYYL